ncbi:MAG: hypothetical protein JWO63_3377, partial [Frankiales bacterium]|nr:hypothetical protein [Frankiales bacterium]
MDRGLWRTYLGLGGLAVGYFLLLPDGLASDLT